MWPLAAVLEGQFDASLSSEEIERIDTIARWCKSYVLQDHEALGRPGVVCPWCPPSVARRCFYITNVRVRFADVDDFIATLNHLRAEYLRLQPESGPDSLFKTLICVLSLTGQPRDADDLTTWMLKVHRLAKPEFLSRGLMLGEFFPGHTATGLRSDTFRPLQAPGPLFVIRAMVPLDIAFLANEVQYAMAYFARFGQESARHVRDVLNIAPGRLAPSKLRPMLDCVRWFDLQAGFTDDRDIVTGALPKHLGYARLQQLLGQDRSQRPSVTAIVLQPRGLGRDVLPGSHDHLRWLWHTPHTIRRATGPNDFLIRDGDRIVAVVAASHAPEIRSAAELSDAAGAAGAAGAAEGVVATVSGLATEADPQAGATDGAAVARLLEAAHADLGRREAEVGRSPAQAAAAPARGHGR